VKDRLVKGRHILTLIKLLETHGKLETLPELVPPGADLIRKPVAPTTWYQLRAFEDLLLSIHRYVFDGSENSGQRMGHLLAAPFLEQSAQADALASGPAAAAELLARDWETHFNFGSVTVEELSPETGSATRIQVDGFPDMSSSHGHLLIGWSMESLARANAKNLSVYIEDRPWMHNSQLTFVLSWTGGSP
jgi:hypothetical protein